MLCGDACYLKRSLDDLHLPGIVADKEAALAVDWYRYPEKRTYAEIRVDHPKSFPWPIAHPYLLLGAIAAAAVAVLTVTGNL